MGPRSAIPGIRILGIDDRGPTFEGLFQSWDASEIGQRAVGSDQPPLVPRSRAFLPATISANSS